VKPKSLIITFPNVAQEVYGDEYLGKIMSSTNLLHGVITADDLDKKPELLKDVEVIFSSWGAPVMDGAFLERALQLRAVFYAAGTIRYWVTDAVWRRNIHVSGAYAINAIPVAEFALATILFSLKDGWRYALGAKNNGRFPSRRRSPGIFRARVGLVSLGEIGRRLCKYLKDHDVELFAYDPFVAERDAVLLGVSMRSLKEIFSECDVISLHTPLLPETIGLITGDLLRLMKPSATFINTARGALVKEDELIATLRDRTDLTAVLDVTDPEPPISESALFRLHNVVLTPHIAGSSYGESKRLGAAMVDDFERWVRGDSTVWKITAETAKRMA
jgi:phosphoglycerate dehydrogenase-like enzyme